MTRYEMFPHPSASPRGRPKKCKKLHDCLLRFHPVPHRSQPPTRRAISSVGRAPRLHRGCREFESLIAHHFLLSSQLSQFLTPLALCRARSNACRPILLEISVVRACKHIRPGAVLDGARANVNGRGSRLKRHGPVLCRDGPSWPAQPGRMNRRAASGGG